MLVPMVGRPRTLRGGRDERGGGRGRGTGLSSSSPTLLARPNISSAKLFVLASSSAPARPAADTSALPSSPDFSGSPADHSPSESLVAETSFTSSKALETGSEETLVDMSQSYMDVGGTKKQRVYGPECKPSSSETTVTSSILISKRELDRLLAKARDLGRAEGQSELRREKDKVRRKQQRLEEQMNNIMQRVGQLPPPPTAGDANATDGEEDLAKE